MKRYLQIIFGLLLACQASFCMAGVPRVALMPSGDPKASAIVELMEVALAQRDDLVLLDRANVDKLLMEQGISLDGFLAADTVLTVGKILKCGVFADLHCMSAGKDFPAMCNLTAFDAITGVRLCDETLDPDADPGKIADAAAGAIIRALAKQRGDMDKGMTVSLLSVRNIDLPIMQSGLAKALCPMLERRLLSQPGMSVLERKRLDQVNMEAALTGDLRDRLLASTALIDIDLSRGKTADTVRLRAVITDTKGKEIDVVELEKNASDIQGLVDDITHELLDVFKSPSSDAKDYSNRHESNRFAAEYDRLIRRGRLDEALVAAHAAVALDPGNLNRQVQLCEVVDQVGLAAVGQTRLKDAADSLEQSLAIRLSWCNQSGKRPGNIPYIQFYQLFRALLTNHMQLEPQDRDRLLAMRRHFHSTVECSHSKGQDNIDLWALSEEEWLDKLFAVPEKLAYPLRWGGFDLFDPKRIAPYTGDPAFRCYNYPRDLSPTGIKRLMDYYQGWAGKGSLQAHYCILALLRFHTEQFSDVDAQIKKTLHKMFTLAIEDTTGSGGSIYYCTRDLFELNLPSEILVPEYKRLFVETERRKIVSLFVVSFLDAHDKEGSLCPGFYLIDACRKLQDKNFTLCAYQYNTPDSGLTSGGIPAAGLPKTLEWFKLTYRQRYGKDMDVGGVAINGSRVPFSGWRSSTKLYSCDEFGGSTREPPCIMSAALVGDAVYLVVYAKRPDYPAPDRKLGYELQRIDLNSGLVEQLARVDHEGGFDGPIHIGSKAAYIPGTAGILVIPLDGRDVWFMSRGVDLVDADVNALAEVENKLYISCKNRDGHILSADLDGSNMVVVASSERREKRTLLDNGDPYQINAFYEDRPRKRLLFGIGGNQGNSGLFALDLENQAISRLWGSKVDDLRAWDPDSCLVGRGLISAELHEWNCVTDKPERFGGDIPHLGNRPSFSGVDSVAALRDRLYGVIYHRTPARGSGLHFMTALRGQPFAAGEVVPEYKDRSAPFFVRAWQGKLVVSDWYTLWLFEPR